MSPKDSDKTRTMHIVSDNIEIITNNKTNGVVKKMLNSLLLKYQDGLEESMRGSKSGRGFTQNAFYTDFIQLYIVSFISRFSFSI